MTNNPDQYRAAVNAAGRLSRVRERLERVDGAVDWSRFDKYLRWLKTDFSAGEGYDPVLLFKAMLVLHWHAFTAPEFDHAIEDSVAIRKFVGIKQGDVGPRHITVNAFRRFLVDRGTAGEALAELHQQLSQNGFLTVDSNDTEAPADGSSEPLFPLANDVRMARPPAWVAIEKNFLDYWASLGTNGEVPSIPIADIGDVPENLKSYFVTLTAQEDDFSFEFVGPKIITQNQGDLLGTTIGARARRNILAYGHAGVQDELISICRAAVARARPVATSTCFFNAMGNRRNLWAIFAQVTDSASGEVGLIGAALIAEVDQVEPKIPEIAASKMSMLPVEIDPFSLETDFRALGPPEWIKIESIFLDYWNEQRGIHKTPMTSNMKLSALAELEPYLTLTRVIKDKGFQYEMIGDHIQIENEGNATGQFIAEKRDFNVREFGHGGLQEELASVFTRAVAQLQPVGTNTYYVNSGGSRCQMWTIHAPMSDEFGEVCMLLGVTLIKKVSIN